MCWEDGGKGVGLMDGGLRITVYVSALKEEEQGVILMELEMEL